MQVTHGRGGRGAPVSGLNTTDALESVKAYGIEVNECGRAAEPVVKFKAATRPGARAPAGEHTDLTNPHAVKESEILMSLQGWSLPPSPAGTAAPVPPPPWHFSGEALGVDFITDPAAVTAVLPAGIEPSGDGSASFVFSDWSSNAEQDPRLAADPARGQYREAYVMVYGRLDGRDIAWVPYIWVDNDLSIARGLIQGSPKKAGWIAISRAVRLGRGGPRLEAGATFRRSRVVARPTAGVGMCHAGRPG